MNRFMANLFLICCSNLFLIVHGIVLWILVDEGMPANGYISTFVKIYMIILIVVALVAIYYGVKLMVYVSEKITPSRRGKRYIVFGLLLVLFWSIFLKTAIYKFFTVSYGILTGVINFAYWNNAFADNLASVDPFLYWLYGIILLVMGIKIAWEKRKKDLQCDCGNEFIKNHCEVIEDNGK